MRCILSRQPPPQSHQPHAPPCLPPSRSSWGSPPALTPLTLLQVQPGLSSRTDPLTPLQVQQGLSSRTDPLSPLQVQQGLARQRWPKGLLDDVVPVQESKPSKASTLVCDTIYME